MKKLMIGLVFLFVSCAGTQIQSTKYPNAPVTVLKRVIVIATNESPKDRQRTEEMFVKELEHTSMIGIPAETLLPQSVGSVCNNKDVDAVLDKNQIDGSLVVIKTDEFRSERYMSPDFVNMSIGSSWNSTFSGSAMFGYSIEQDVFLYKISLLDRKCSPLWSAQTTTKGTRGGMISRSLAQTTVNKMIEDGVIR